MSTLFRDIFRSRLIDGYFVGVLACSLASGESEAPRFTLVCLVVVLFAPQVERTHAAFWAWWVRPAPEDDSQPSSLHHGRIMNRRDWLTKTSIALASGLVLGDAVLEEYERLTHRRIFALGGLRDDTDWLQAYLDNPPVDAVWWHTVLRRPWRLGDPTHCSWSIRIPKGHYRLTRPLVLRQTRDYPTTIGWNESVIDDRAMYPKLPNDQFVTLEEPHG